MPRKQTRRAVSLRGETYDRVKSYCNAHGLTLSGFVEMRIAAFFAHHDADDRYPGSTLTKEKPVPAKNGSVRGGGVHEL